MTIKIPFSVLPPKALEKLSPKFLALAERIQPLFPYLQLYLKQAKVDIHARRYLSYCLCASSSSFVMLFLFFTFTLGTLKVPLYWMYSFFLACFFIVFIFMQQIYYPRLTINRRIADLEQNTLPAIQSMYIQLRSGVPLFDIMANIAGGNYGEVSKEFLHVVKQINAGKHQVDALEEMTMENPSVIFRRAVWQIVNGLKTGTDMGHVIQEIIHTLYEEQINQIEKYGGQLGPLSMFYMLIAVIFPALGINFLIILTSFIQLSEGGIKFVFWGTYAAVTFFQVIFMGFIKSRRPNLIGG